MAEVDVTVERCDGRTDISIANAPILYVARSKTAGETCHSIVTS